MAIIYLTQERDFCQTRESRDRAQSFSPPLDAGIAEQVDVLAGSGIETFESCEGGAGHSYAEPTVRFHGDRAEGFRAFGVAKRAGLHVRALRRTYCVIDGELTGPYWEMTFHRGQQM
jgi:hypothetical protein